MIKQQIVFGILIILYMVFVLRRLGSKHISVKFALLWIPLGIVMFVLDFNPDLLSWITNKMGLEIPANLVFSVGILFLLLQVFLLSTELSKQDEKVRVLAQNVALLSKKIEDEKEE